MSDDVLDDLIRKIVNDPDRPRDKYGRPMWTDEEVTDLNNEIRNGTDEHRRRAWRLVDAMAEARGGA